jgi:hypothetical protein
VHCAGVRRPCIAVALSCGRQAISACRGGSRPARSTQSKIASVLRPGCSRQSDVAAGDIVKVAGFELTCAGMPTMWIQWGVACRGVAIISWPSLPNGVITGMPAVAAAARRVCTVILAGAQRFARRSEPARGPLEGRAPVNAGVLFLRSGRRTDGAVRLGDCRQCCVLQPSRKQCQHGLADLRGSREWASKRPPCLSAINHRRHRRPPVQCRVIASRPFTWLRFAGRARSRAAASLFLRSCRLANFCYIIALTTPLRNAARRGAPPRLCGIR